MMDNHATLVKFDNKASFKNELPFEVEAFGVETFEIRALDVEGCGEKSLSLSLSVSLKMILPTLKSSSSPVTDLILLEAQNSFISNFLVK